MSGRFRTSRPQDEELCEALARRWGQLQRGKGTFRNHMMTASRMRHSVRFSIVDTEWSGVKAPLEELLDSAGR
jgi:hypothetical protein